MDTLNEDLSFYNYADLIEIPTLVVEKGSSLTIFNFALSNLPNLRNY